VDAFIAQSSQQFVRTRTPQPAAFTEAIRAAGATVVQEDDGALSVTGLDAQHIGDVAFERRVALHELSPQRASLEEAFMELTHDSVDYRPVGANNDHAAPKGK
jgi:ABC-2 type transport system ATP-binding protein